MKSCHQLLKNEAGMRDPVAAVAVACVSPTRQRAQIKQRRGLQRCHQLVSSVTNEDSVTAVNLSPTVSPVFRQETEETPRHATRATGGCL